MWHALTPISSHPSIPIHVSQKEEPTTILMEFDPTWKLRTQGHQVDDKSPWTGSH
jgi:hypothetical protein